MGHYDSDYERTEELQRKANREKAEKALIAMRKFQKELRDVPIPDRFRHHLEDLSNYLKVNHDLK